MRGTLAGDAASRGPAEPVRYGASRGFRDKRRWIAEKSREFGIEEVRAEAQSAGDWYYGTVSAKQIEDLLDGGVKAGILKLKQ